MLVRWVPAIVRALPPVRLLRCAAHRQLQGRWSVSTLGSTVRQTVAKGSGRLHQDVLCEETTESRPRCPRHGHPLNIADDGYWFCPSDPSLDARWAPFRNGESSLTESSSSG